MVLLFISQRLHQILFESQMDCNIVQFKLLRWKSSENIVSLKSENKGDMTTIELKKQLTNRILEIDDESFLQAIKTILDSKTQSQVITLTKTQRQKIEESQKQVEAGEFIEQDELDQKFNQWKNLL
jgi:predicted transcriptional regulator